MGRALDLYANASTGYAFIANPTVTGSNPVQGLWFELLLGIHAPLKVRPFTVTVYQQCFLNFTSKVSLFCSLSLKDQILQLIFCK